MKALKLSENQKGYIMEYLLYGMPENIVDRHGENQANIIKRTIKRITNNPVWDAIKNTKNYYNDDLKDLLTMLECKKPQDYTLDIDSLNIMYMAYEYSKENECKGYTLTWFTEWMNSNNIYSTFESLKRHFYTIASDFPEYISISFQKDLDNINLNK